MNGLIEGRIVHYVLPDGKHRPALVVNVWNKDKGECNLQVFLDDPNDRIRKEEFYSPVWMGTIAYDELMSPNTWHWIERI